MQLAETLLLWQIGMQICSQLEKRRAACDPGISHRGQVRVDRLSRLNAGPKIVKWGGRPRCYSRMAAARQSLNELEPSKPNQGGYRGDGREA